MEPHKNRKQGRRSLRGLVLALLLALLPAIAHAVPEICANGLDDDSTGGDALCSGIDQDNDGDPSLSDGGTDCDDTDYKVHNGEYYPVADCSGSAGYRKCNNGTWDSCVKNSVTPLCEKTAAVGAACYYINNATGSNSTGDGSYGNPWQTYACVSHYNSSPPSCNVDPAPGSVIYLLGTGTYSATLSLPGVTEPVLYGANTSNSGTAGNPVVLKRYPGATVSFTFPGTYVSGTNGSQVGTSGFGFNLDTVSYMNLVDLAGSGGWGSAIYAPGSDHIRVLRGSFIDKDGYAINNLSIFNVTGGDYNEFSWNYVYNITDTHRVDGNITNVTAVSFFNDNSGGGHKANYNRIGWPANSANGIAIRWKHGAKVVPTNSEAKGNIIWNPNAGIEVNTKSVYASQNLIYGSSDPYAFRYDVGAGGDDVISDVIITRNTVVESKLLIFGTAATFDDTLGPVDFSHNVNYDSSAFGGDESGINIMKYGNNAALAELLPTFIIDENAYWNAGSSGYKWDWFSDNGGTGPGPSGNLGFSTTTYATWRDYPVTVNAGYTKFDVNSASSSFSLSTDGSFTYSGGVDAGWRTGLDEPDPTPTPTPTPTPAPSLGGAAMARNQRTIRR